MIRTNNKPRHIVNGFELSDAERREFDYMDDVTEGTFFRYKGLVYDIGEFSRIIEPGAKRCHPMECQSVDMQGWHGYLSDSFFSAIVLKWADDDHESIIVGTYIA